MYAKKIAQCIIFLAAYWLLCSCAYQFQDAHNPLKPLGVERIYVVNFENGTFRPGIEQVFTTAIVREIQKSNALRLVNTEASADAILTGKILSADSTVSSTRATQIDAKKQVNVASEYFANVTCLVSLTDRHGKVLFSQTINSAKTYPGSNCSRSSDVLCVPDQSSTIALINESEQRLAIDFLATQMMSSMYQRIVSAF